MLRALKMITLASLTTTSSLAQSITVPPPPPTVKQPVTETVHGTVITDDYRWLEGDNSDPKQMGKMADQVATWTDAQNARTRSILDNLPGRKAVEDRLRPLMQIGSVSAPQMAGSRYFYTKREGTENQPKLMLRESSSGPSRVLIDPSAIDPTGLTTMGGYLPNHDGSMLAFTLYRAGDENTTIYFMNTNTGVWLADTLEGKASPIQWMPDNSGFFYERLADVKDPYSARIMYHVMGTHPRQDKILFKQYTKEENEKLATTWGPGANVSKDGKWMSLMYWTGTSSNDLWIINLEKWFKDGTFEKQVVKTGEPNTFFGGVDVSGEKPVMFMLTDYKAPKKQIIAVDPNNPSEENWKVIVPENPTAVLQSFGISKGILAADYEERASSKIKLFDRAGKSLGDLNLPGIGSAGLSTEDDRTEAYLSFTSFNYPNTIFRVDLASPQATPVVWERPEVPVDPSTVEVKQVTYSSKDGTPVTMFIIHKKGLKLDGNNPTILNGYGGFNISETPFFSPTLFPWFEAGGVFALPNLRGGGEYGKAWHEAGMLDKKQNVFDDMIAAAEYLITNNYTSPSKLGASGGSNGGLLMGALMVQRPELFRAIVCAVPLLDMIRYQDFLMARYWVPEYGTAENEKDFQWLIKYSPYHNIKQGVKYPGIMFTTGENDTRVHPMHARKMAAAMQAATSSDPNTHPIMLWVDRDAGHGAGKPLNIRLRDAVDGRMFFMWQLGMLPQN